MEKKLYQKWWFWVIVAVLIVFGIIGIIMENSEKVSTEMKTDYISKYEWKLKDTKTEDLNKYVVLEVENKNGDLESGDYIIKTNDNPKASFTIIVTDQYYEKIADIPGTYDGMVQGFDESEYEVNLSKGQYLYLIQGTNGQGKVIVTKK